MQTLNTQDIEQISGGLLHTPGFQLPPEWLALLNPPVPTLPPTNGPIIA